MLHMIELWAPFAVLIGVFLFFSTRSRRRSDDLVDLYRLHVAEAAKQTEILNRIAATLEKRDR